MSFFNGPLASLVGTLLCRVLVPAWVLTGALFKLMEHTPRLLPESVRYVGTELLGIPLYPLLATLIAIELVAVAVMVCVGRLARVVAVGIMAIFVFVLVAEVAAGNTSCGCLGANSPSPLVMLVVDGALLVGLVLFGQNQRSRAIPAAPAGYAGAAVLSLAGIGAAYGIVIPAGAAPEPQPGPGDGGGTQVVSDDPTVNPGPKPLPGVWYVQDIESWLGRPWREIELFQFMPRWPAGLDEGVRYVVFYSRTCDHCEEMFLFDLADEARASRTAAVEIPASKTTLTSEKAWQMPQTTVQQLALPLGCDWVITSPLTVRIEDGVVRCAQEGEHAECMGLLTE